MNNIKENKLQLFLQSYPKQSIIKTLKIIKDISNLLGYKWSLREKKELVESAPIYFSLDIINSKISRQEIEKILEDAVDLGIDIFLVNNHQLSETKFQELMDEATNFETPPQRLKKIRNVVLSYRDDKGKKILQALTSNPNTPIEILVKLAQYYPQEFLANPALDLHLLTNLNLLAEIPEKSYFSLIKVHNVPSSFLLFALNNRPEINLKSAIIAYHQKFWNDWWKKKDKNYTFHLASADFQGQNLRNLDLNNVNLAKANLSQADLRKVKLNNTNLSNVNLSQADLRGAKLNNTLLDKVNFQGTKINEYTEITELGYSLWEITNYPQKFMTKSSSKLKELLIDLEVLNHLNEDALINLISSPNVPKLIVLSILNKHKKQSKRVLNIIVIHHKNIWNQWRKNHPQTTKIKLNFRELKQFDLSGINFSNMNLRGIDFSETNLAGTNLINTDLIDTNLTGANLQNSDLRFANLEGANLQDANLENANLEGIQTDEFTIIDPKWFDKVN